MKFRQNVPEYIIFSHGEMGRMIKKLGSKPENLQKIRDFINWHDHYTPYDQINWEIVGDLFQGDKIKAAILCYLFHKSRHSERLCLSELLDKVLTKADKEKPESRPPQGQFVINIESIEVTNNVLPKLNILEGYKLDCSVTPAYTHHILSQGDYTSRIFRAVGIPLNIDYARMEPIVRARSTLHCKLLKTFLKDQDTLVGVVSVDLSPFVAEEERGGNLKLELLAVDPKLEKKVVGVVEIKYKWYPMKRVSLAVSTIPEN